MIIRFMVRKREREKTPTSAASSVGQQRLCTGGG
jgi:hypothetical protein